MLVVVLSVVHLPFTLSSKQPAYRHTQYWRAWQSNDNDIRSHSLSQSHTNNKTENEAKHNKKHKQPGRLSLPLLDSISIRSQLVDDFGFIKEIRYNNDGAQTAQAQHIHTNVVSFSTRFFYPRFSTVRTTTTFCVPVDFLFYFFPLSPFRFVYFQHHYGTVLHFDSIRLSKSIENAWMNKNSTKKDQQTKLKKEEEKNNTQQNKYKMTNKTISMRSRGIHTH